jgi:SAM-dependent MidA family methyltransferase
VRTEFESSTENAALKDAIVARIERENGINFRNFMAMALYEPRLGYYWSDRPPIGREGDYLTSPEVSPVFGVMVGRQLREMWEAMGSPSRFDIVESGAGNGTLCRDILSWMARAAPEMLEATRYTIVEPLPPLEARQRSAVEAHSLDEKVGWQREPPSVFEGCIVTNELLDSLPVHRVAVECGRLREVFVCWDGARFVEEIREPSTPEIEAYFERTGLLPGEGCTAEVNLAATKWMAQAGEALQRGFVLTFDYGYEAEELYAPWRKDGTLLCFYKHNPSSDPYARIGRQDMTSHVDFTSIRRSGEEAKLTTLGLASQSDFLINIGIAEAVPPASGGIGLEEHLARRRAVSELLDLAGLGRIRVLAQTKGVGNVKLRGFARDA